MKKLLLSVILLASSLFANGNRFHDFAKVNYSEPIYEYVYDNEPQKECRDVRKKVRVYDDSYSRNENLGIDTLIGVATGAVIGSQIGKGNGRVAAQIVGGLLGGKVAHEIRDYDSTANANYEYITKTECYTSYKRIKRKMITGYKNHFVYKGEDLYKVTKRPKKKIKITHSISY